ncbi:unnamed protein product [Symbiodinium necroappetens]|uniref:Uncharacterized protein n=1 Tax=Symbiodinium necroappetens TaxID=1628268 RepID=A0A812Q282_9DINO|nr:unnamed protein product [Symbiodinium necroappetens]
MLALDRFASKGGGLMGYDSTLDDLGLHDLAPPNACRPKALGALREQRLAAKQELKAVRNILEHANFDLDSIFPETPLRPTAHADEIRCEHRVGSEVLAFHVSTTTGESTWAAVMPEADKAVRLVLAPDEGGPLYACYQFMALQNAKVTLNRDALLLVYCRMCELSGWLFRSKKSPWGTHATGNNLSEAEPGDALMQLFARDILKENGIDESGDEHLNFTRTVEILDKAARNKKGSFSWSRWCSWAHTAGNYQYSAHLLQLFWSSMEVPAPES